MGGVLVIVVAGVIGLAQNAARDDRIPLIPTDPASVSEKPYTPPSAQDHSATAPAIGNDDTAGKGEPSALFTDEELASGKVSLERMKELVEKGRIVIIDARAAQEYATGHIAGAISVPYEELTDHYNKVTQTVPLDATVVCYCRSVTCDDSENLARELRFMGYRHVATYQGGWDEWSQAGYPAESSNPDKGEG